MRKLSKRKTIVALFLLLATTVSLLSVALLLNPWRRSDASIRARLLTVTPLGSKLSDVRTILDQKGWNEPSLQKTWPLPVTHPFLGGPVGEYQGFSWYATVYAYWQFDNNDQLIDILIERHYDAP